MDGYIARARNQITITGKLLDPLADVAFYITAFIALFIQGWIPFTVIFILTVREISINIIIRPIISYLMMNPQAKLPGKIKTVYQSVLLIIILISRVAVEYFEVLLLFEIVFVLSYVLAILSLVSAIPYIASLHKT